MKKTFSSVFLLLIAAAMTLIIFEAFILMEHWDINAIRSPAVSNIACAPDSRYSYTKKGLASTKNVTDMRNFDSAWMNSREDVYMYKNRRTRLESVCAKYEGKRWPNEIPGRNFMFDLENELAYCQNAKVKMSGNSLNMLVL